MSSDNGVYVGIFPVANGMKEYRVIECQCIENVNYGDTDFQDHQRLGYFGDAKPIHSYHEAQIEAKRLYDEVMQDFGICEYDISDIPFERPLLSKPVKEAQEWLDNWNAGRDKKLKPLQDAVKEAEEKVWSDPRVDAASKKIKQAQKEYDNILYKVKEEYGLEKVKAELLRASEQFK